jgi:histidinol dehydrogenase
MLVPILTTAEAGFRAALDRLRARAQSDRRVEAQARRIVEAVRRGGDRALFDLIARFDGTRLAAEELCIDRAQLRRALDSLPKEQRQALELAARRIEAFHRHQRERSWSVRDRLGLNLGQRLIPLERVGIYVPGGHASYPSSVLMNALPARVAGVSEIIMATPSRGDGPSPAVLAAAALAGVERVFRMGGAHAIAALAFGTASVPKVDKITGPGNAWVQAAKRLVYGIVDIDGVAGPSEVLVIADDSADPAFVAADLLAQAEHGSGDETALALTDCRVHAIAVQAELARQLRTLPRRKEIARVLRRGAALIVVRDLDEAIALANEIAPEHLELLVRKPRQYLPRLRNAGAVFLGPYAPAPLGDYIAGPNHVLPTGGSARFFSPLGVYDFVKRTSVVECSAQALRALAPAISTLAEMEGYTAHAAAVTVRFPTPQRAAKKRGQR